MTKSTDRPNCVNKVGTFLGEDAAYGKTSVRYRPSQMVFQQPYHRERNFSYF